MQPIIERPMKRCKGPWPACGHADDTCTACPSYQARIQKRFQLPEPDQADTPCSVMGEAMARYKHAELTAGEAVSIILEQAKRLSHAPMEAVAWREKVAAIIQRTVNADRDEFCSAQSADEAARALQALAVIPTEGLGSSLRDTHRAEDRAVVAEKESGQ